MSAETRKQLAVGYCLLSALMALTMFLDSGQGPLRLLGWFSDPVFKTLIVLFLVFMAPGIAGSFLVGIGVVLLFFMTMAAITTPIWIVLSLASLGIGGFFLAIGAAFGMYHWGRIAWAKYGEEWTAQAALALKYVQMVVEFFAWADFLFDTGLRKLGVSVGKAAIRPDRIRVAKKEERVAQVQTLEMVTAEIVRLQKRYPDLPAPPDAYHANTYEGWFMEARKRFEMQSFNRTQADRVEVLKRIAEINELYLKIARQEGEKHTFEQEQRIRSKRMTLDEIDVDGKIEDLQYERQKKREERSRPPVPPTLGKPPDFADEIVRQLERAVRTESRIREVFSEFRSRSPHMSDWLNEWEARELWDLKEKKWS